MVEFGDISSYQAGADLTAYAAAGHDRIMIKATGGATYINPDLRAWWTLAGELGLARGLYHYARPSASIATEESNHLAAVIGSLGGLGPRDWVILDIEDKDVPAANMSRVARHAAGLAAELIRLGLPDGILYSYTDYLHRAGITATVMPTGWRSLHLANYNPIDDDRVPLPDGWFREQVVARQYTETASQPGIPGLSDRSRVLREWLPQEDDVTPEDRAAIINGTVNALIETLWAQMGDAATPQRPIRQGGPGQVLGAMYLNQGDDTNILRQLLRLVAAQNPHAAAAVLPSAAEIERAIDTETDPGLLAGWSVASSVRLREVLTTPATVGYPETAPS